MDRDTFLADERAVPPVIGVILMVGIVVVMAAIVTSYVFGLGIFGFETVPQAQLTTDFTEGGSLPTDGCSPGSGSSDSVLNITHNGGDTMEADGLSIVVAGLPSQSWDDCSGADTEVANQDSAHVEVDSDDVVRLVWESENEDNSHTLVTWNGTAET